MRLNALDMEEQAKLSSIEIENNGFSTIVNFFTKDEIEAFEECVLELFFLQARKIGEYSNKAYILKEGNLSNFEKLSAIYEMMEPNDKEALYQVQKLIASSPQARAIFNEKLLKLAASILKSNRSSLLTEGPALFVNKPNSDRLLYKWHSEANYYPKRRRFLNIWFPLFHAKTKANGTMSFKERSHLRDFPFSEYRGYSKETLNKENYYNQYEVPINFLEGYKEHWCEIEPKDLIVFHRNLVHTSNPNKSSKYSFAVVSRIWDPTDDLTLSGSMGATSSEGGRSNLVVDPLE